MQVKAFISLFLAAAATAAPTVARDIITDNPVTGAIAHNPVTGAIANNPVTAGGAIANNPVTGVIANNPVTGAIANNPVANGNGVGVGKISDNNPVVASGNKVSDNNVLNDSLNIANGADSQKITEDVVAAIKGLTMTCTSEGEGAMKCTW